MHPDLTITNGTVFTGSHLLDGMAVLVRRGCVAGFRPVSVPAAAHETVLDLAGGLVCPGFVDLQVNGGGGVLFTDRPTVDALRTITDAHRRFGTTDLLATVVTAPAAVLARARAAVDRAVADGVEGVLGIHFEGPLISPHRPGVHDTAHITTRPEVLDPVLEGAGVTMVTLAPERVDPGLVARWVARGVVVSVGHSDADAACVTAAVDAGARCATHLWNAMRPPLAREPGVVGAVLDDARVRCGVIADGHHLADAVLRATLRALGPERAILVTDAMPCVGSDLTVFMLGDTPVRVADGRCTTPAGTLAGSALDMASAVRNAVRRGGVPLQDALRMASRTPAAAVGMDHRLGRIAVGRPARLTMLSPALEVTGVVLGGRVFPAAPGLRAPRVGG